MNGLRLFRQVASQPYQYCHQLKQEKSQKILGYFCSYTPEELIYAAGALPFRIFGSEANLQHADAHLQAYCCSMARSGLEAGLSGQLNFLDGVIFPHTCDTMQRLSDIWRLNAGFPLHFDIVLPIKLDSASAFHYLHDIFLNFKDELERKLDCEITEEKLTATIRLYNQIRRRMEELYRLRSQNPELISGSDVYAIMRAATVMDRGQFCDLLMDLLPHLKHERSAYQQRHKKRILLTGGVCNYPDIYSIVEDAGGAVVWDDLCTGSRWFNGLIDEKAAPIEAIARRYFERVICPTKHRNNIDRAQHLVALAKQQKIHGVIFLLLKFCDPHAFDYPYLKYYLDKQGIPNMLLEIEDQIAAIGQLRTRLEAFLEMI